MKIYQVYECYEGTRITIGYFSSYAKAVEAAEKVYDKYVPGHITIKYEEHELDTLKTEE